MNSAAGMGLTYLLSWSPALSGAEAGTHEAPVPALSAWPAVVPALEQPVQDLLSALPAVARDAAQRMPDPGRRLLAVRSYLRSGASLVERWSWSNAEAVSFASSAAGQSLQRDIESVRRHFSAANPGYTLFVQPAFRTLEVQLQRWNTNESVGRSAARLLQDLRRDTAKSAIAFDAARLRAWLTSWSPMPVPTLAAPGLSAHGRGNAVDFQIFHGSRLVAGPDTSTVSATWERDGWAARLADAVSASGAPFDGPLRSPHEPWHYRYGRLPR